ncbi:unnamed protein product [Spirodela intermedia]|uniref:Uncharacterized protein n=1 Tax=Spirodela intermedia TaxID=51605 RepID=A0A7I8J4P5_SPIIN|nr:unnamed protein product [Spirodela intermedia]CAA6665197.1 unnamed protein product [Spirodela intermedia]
MVHPSGGSSPLHQPQRSKKQQAAASAQSAAKRSHCRCSHGAAVDVVVLVVVLFAFGFLLVPYLRLFFNGLSVVGSSVLVELREESLAAPMVWLFVVLSFFVLSVAVSAVFLCAAGGRKCGDPNCRGLRNAAEFDVRIETEEHMKNSDCPDGNDGSGRLFFELNEKMAPPRGRAVLLFQEKCGCSVGRLVVNGPKKVRKLKKSAC